MDTISRITFPLRFIPVITFTKNVPTRNTPLQNIKTKIMIKNVLLTNRTGVNDTFNLIREVIQKSFVYVNAVQHLIRKWVQRNPHTAINTRRLTRFVLTITYKMEPTITYPARWVYFCNHFQKICPQTNSPRRIQRKIMIQNDSQTRIA